MILLCGSYDGIGPVSQQVLVLIILYEKKNYGVKTWREINKII